MSRNETHVRAVLHCLDGHAFIRRPSTTAHYSGPAEQSRQGPTLKQSYSLASPHLVMIASYSSCVPNLTAMTICKKDSTNERNMAAKPIPWSQSTTVASLDATTAEGLGQRW